VSFYTPSAGFALTPSPLTPLDFRDHEGLSQIEGIRSRSSKPSATSDGHLVSPEQGRRLTTTSPGAPHSDLGQNPPFNGVCRPAVIVYKVAKGPNLAKSKDIVRISYGEGHQKRTRMKISGRRNKVRDGSHYSLRASST